jgi:cellobiose epimerase
MDFDARIPALKDELLQELEGNILRYWSSKMVDNEYGGFFGRRDGHDKLVEKADKAVILNTRILWTFSCAAKNLNDPKLRILSDRAYRYLTDYFIDKEQGGVYWMVDYQGNAVQTKKQIYALAFAIYALAEYYQATRIEASLEHAKNIFLLIEKHSFDHERNGYLEAFDRDWNLLEDLRLSDKDANEKKTMNTHLHLLEAYTNLYKVWRDATLKDRLQNLIIIFRDRIINKKFHFDLFFDEDWNVRSSEVSYGHDIEGSWLLYEAAEVLGDPGLKFEIENLSRKVVDVTISEGMSADGGIKNEAHDTDRHWWPQAEALVGLVNIWQLTGQTSYLSGVFRVWEFIRERLIDRKNGEWYWRVNDAGEVNFREDKAGPWKCPYHNGRAMIELLNRLQSQRQQTPLH